VNRGAREEQAIQMRRVHGPCRRREDTAVNTSSVYRP